MSTSVSPDAGRIWRAARTPVVIGLIILAGAVIMVLLRGNPAQGALDPEATQPDGSRALAQLLREQGVQIETVRTAADADQALNRPGPATLLVTQPDLVLTDRLVALRDNAEDTVLVGAKQETVERLLPGARALGTGEPRTVPPGCTVAAAVAAGNAVSGGTRFLPPPGGRSCYSGTLIHVPGNHGTTLLGDGFPLANKNLATEGNAALSMRLLGEHPRLVWYLPSPSDPALRPGERSLTSLIPDGWRFGAIELGVAAVLFALWRARRLGPVVPERLPVVVRAAETTEGRARLYRRSGAVDHAASLLRQATRDRLLPALGLGPGAEPPAVVEAAAARSGRAPAEVATLLYGPPPSGDPELVRLADLLDELEREVTGS